MRLKDTLGITYVLGKIELKVRKKIDRMLSRYKITSPQYSVLAALEENLSLTNADLARLCFVTPQTMSRIVQNLERDGFLKKNNQKDTDGLKIFYKITALGEKTVCKAHAEIFELEKQMIKGLSKLDIQKFKKTIDLCCENLKDKK